MKIDFTNPLYVRRYLRLFQADTITGFRFKPNVLIEPHVLGFSLETNSLGFRGADDRDAHSAILGTSYAMGLAVNNGENWYEISQLDKGWLNLGLPIGFDEIRSAFEAYGNETIDRVVFIYHPNLWPITLRMMNWRNSETDIFRFLRWETKISRVAPLYLRRILRTIRLRRSSKLLNYKASNGTHRLSAIYNFSEPESANLPANALRKLMKRLGDERDVYCLRLPIKEEVFLRSSSVGIPVAFSQLQENYDFHYHEFLIHTPNCRHFDVRDRFSINDFIPSDNHFNFDGNMKFSKLVSDILKS